MCVKLQGLGHKLWDNGGAKCPCQPIVELVICLSVLCSVMASLEEVAAVGQVLVDPAFNLTRRFRALFTLKNLGGKLITNPPKTFIHHTASVLLQSYCLIHILKGTVKIKKIKKNWCPRLTWWTPQPFSHYSLFWRDACGPTAPTDLSDNSQP